MQTYPLLLIIHVACAVTTLALFALRGILQLRAPDAPLPRPLRVIPHVVDTVLLSSALGMAALAGFLRHPPEWLLAKLGAVVIYIALGFVALRFATTLRVRAAAFGAAIATFAYLVSVALTKSVWPWA